MGYGFGLRELTRLRRSRLALAAALPSAVGYAIPLVAGLATGHVADGLTASAGALIVGFANLGGPTGCRSGTLLAATAAPGSRRWWAGSPDRIPRPRSRR